MVTRIYKLAMNGVSSGSQIIVSGRYIPITILENT